MKRGSRYRKEPPCDPEASLSRNLQVRPSNPGDLNTIKLMTIMLGNKV